MKLISHTRRSLLLGIALLGATTLTGFSSPASAQPRRDYDAPNRDNTQGWDETEAPETDTVAPQDPQQPQFGGRRGGRGRGPGSRGPSSREPGRFGGSGRPQGEGGREGGRDEFEDSSRPRGSRGGRPGFRGRRGDEENGFDASPRFPDGGRDRRGGRGQGRFEGRGPGEGEGEGEGRGSGRRDFRGEGRRDGQRLDNREQNRRDFPTQPEMGAQDRLGNAGIINPNVFGGSAKTYTGTVTRVRSNQSFDVRIGGSTFNVYTTSPTPAGLSQGVMVRINGVQKYNNDIRDARVVIVGNR